MTLKFSFLTLLTLVLTVCFSSVVEAQTAEKNAQEELPQKAQMAFELERLFDEIARNPENLNNNYRYAKLAEKLGKFFETIAAYERMLMANPKLDRVKLDLAFIYMKVGNLVEAKRLFLEVKAKNPPETVVNNIDNMIAIIDKGFKRHHFGGTVTLGYTADSNPSASPNSGSVDVFGVGIPIDDATGSATDEQKFVYASLNHSYIIPGESKNLWNSEIGFYKSVQDNASNLNTTVYSFKTGPVINTKGKRLRYGATATCSRVNLDEREYLNSFGYEVFADYILSRNAKVRLSQVHEERKFVNNPDVTTYEDRNGFTNERKVLLTSMLTPKDILNTTVAIKKEHALVAYYTNNSKSFGMNYTHLFSQGVFANMSAFYKQTNYKDVDTFVNPNVIRRDSERTLTFGLGKNLTDKVSCSLIYQNKNINSNIQNYAYRNKRLTTSLSFKF